MIRRTPQPGVVLRAAHRPALGVVVTIAGKAVLVDGGRERAGIIAVGALLVVAVLVEG